MLNLLNSFDWSRQSLSLLGFLTNCRLPQWSFPVSSAGLTSSLSSATWKSFSDLLPRAPSRAAVFGLQQAHRALCLEIYNSVWYSLFSAHEACISSLDVKLEAYLEEHSTDPNDRQAAARQGRSKLVRQSALNSSYPEYIPLTGAPSQPLATAKSPHTAHAQTDKLSVKTMFYMNKQGKNHYFLYSLSYYVLITKDNQYA